MTTKDEATKILAVRRAFDAGAERANRNRWSATLQRQLEANVRRILRAVLGREPTTDEIAATIHDDEGSALDLLKEAVGPDAPGR